MKHEQKKLKIWIYKNTQRSEICQRCKANKMLTKKKLKRQNMLEKNSSLSFYYFIILLFCLFLSTSHGYSHSVLGYRNLAANQLTVSINARTQNLPSNLQNPFNSESYPCKYKSLCFPKKTIPPDTQQKVSNMLTKRR